MPQNQELKEVRVPHEKGGDAYNQRSTIRGLMQMAREMVNDRSTEICEMVAQDWMVDKPLFPFLCVADEHPLKASAEKIGYVVKLSRAGGFELHKLPPTVSAPKEAVGEAVESGASRGSFLDFADIANDIVHPPQPEVKIEEEKAPEETGAYPIKPNMDPERIIEFVSHIEMGLLTYIEITLAHAVARHSRKVRPILKGAANEMHHWDNVHGKLMPKEGPKGR